MMTKACWILFAILTYGTLKAQPPFQLSGKVTDTVGIALFYATVQLIDGKDTISTLTREDGLFVFSNRRIRKFRLHVDMKGFLAFDQSFVVDGERSSIRLSPIVLKEHFNELDPVIISRMRPVTIGEDTVSYHVAAFLVREGSEVVDILKRLPEVEVDIDGNVVVQGKKIERVLINGKEFFGGDVLLAIQNLPADIVDKLQVIDDYGDKARLTNVKSGEAVKVLNIVLKQDKRNGEFARSEAGAGAGGKYVANGIANRFKEERQLSVMANFSNNSPTENNYTRNGGVNYANQWDKHWGGGGNMNFGGADPHASSSLLQDNFYPGEQLHQVQSSRTNGENRNGILGGNLIYKPDGCTTLRLSPSITLQKSLNQVADTFSTLQQDTGFSKATSGVSQIKSQASIRSGGGSLYFEKLSSHSKGRFSAQVNIQHSDNQQSTDNLARTMIVTDSVSSSLTHYTVGNNTSFWNVNASAYYYVPIGVSSFLELGYIGKSSVSKTTQQTQEPGFGNNGLVTIDSLSQNIFFHTFSHQLHAGYSTHVGRLNLSLGVDGQPGLLEGTLDAKGDLSTYHYFSLLPVAQSSWALSKTQRLSFSYRGSPGLPTQQQVAPLTDLTNPQYPVAGNPKLKPSFTQAVSAHYEKSALQPTQFHGFGVSIGYTTTQDPITTYTAHPRDSSDVIQRTTFVNAGNASSVNGDYHLTLPTFLNKRFLVTMGGNLIRSHNTVLTDSLRYTNITLSWTQTLHLQLLIPDIIETDVSANYSVSHSSYPGSASLPNTFEAASVMVNSRNYLLQKWILNYQYSQLYMSIGGRLKTTPAVLTAALQRQFLAHNKATISIAGYNLLNSAASVGADCERGRCNANSDGIQQSILHMLNLTLKLSRFKN